MTLLEYTMMLLLRIENFVLLGYYQIQLKILFTTASIKHYPL